MKILAVETHVSPPLTEDFALSIGWASGVR
jgi:hypothetical protein